MGDINGGGEDDGPITAIMNAAIHLFGSQGYNGTSMRDIASAVGVLPGSLYAHIRSKDMLLADIVADGMRRFRQAVEPIAHSGDSEIDRLRHMIVAHADVIADNPERAHVVFHQWRFLKTEQHEHAAARLRAYEDLFVTLVREGMADGKLRSDLNVRITMLSMLGALNSIPEWFSSQGTLSMTDISNVVADTLLMGIRA